MDAVPEAKVVDTNESADIAVAGVSSSGEFACVGIGGATDAGDASNPGRTPRWNISDQLSVRTDWSSQDDLSPQRSTRSDGFSHSELENYSRDLRSCRRTLTTMVSPRNSFGKPLRYGVHSIQNMRQKMEDAHRAVLGVEGWSPSTSRPSSREGMEASLGSMSYFAIFDGHAGSEAAKFASENLCELLAADRTALLSEPSEALRRALARTEEEWLERARSREWMDGTTAAVALVDRAGCRCIVGNIGDSEILLGSRGESGLTEYKILTEVHHLKRSPSEVDRVSSVGGRIWRGRLGHPKISPQVLSLSVSRAIGDLFFKDEKYTDGVLTGLSAEAYIATVEICAEQISDEFLVIGCDGLWDTVKYAEAADFVLERLHDKDDPQAISEGLVRLAREAGSSDNITVMVVVM
mmetsp:Transcript_37455/g.94165  ORF Transcript_37455/g.94165 Transcript_37455/m.94165 type:complete len:409 (-) Transcript_37455:28-1254(-)